MNWLIINDDSRPHSGPPPGERVKLRALLNCLFALVAIATLQTFPGARGKIPKTFVAPGSGAEVSLSWGRGLG